MKREREVKFDVPLDLDINDFLERLRAIVSNMGYSVLSSQQVERTFQYYDTHHLEVYRNGETIRRVGGFDHTTSKGFFRYDFKKGSIDERYETNYWANERLSASEILERLRLRSFYQVIFPSAAAETQHHKMKIRREGTLIEVVLDYFMVLEGARFRELELELEDGQMSDLTVLAEHIRDGQKVTPMTTQKYSRVIESISRYRSLLRNDHP